jgi:hypothetical protein
MDIQPLHTKIEKIIQSTFGTIVLEDPSGFPIKECNLYCVGPDGKIVWMAEKPDAYTLYFRVRFNDDGSSLATYSTHNHACDLDLRTGKILDRTSMQ